jgi:hypothetical protein
MSDHEPTSIDDYGPLVDRLKAVLDAPPGHHVFSTTVDADLLREAIAEIERLRECVNIVANESDVAGDGDRVVVSLPSADYRHVLMVSIDER